MKTQLKKQFIKIYIFLLIVFETLFERSKQKLSKIIFFVVWKKKRFNLTYFFVIKHKKIVYYKKRHWRINQNVNNRILKTTSQNHESVFYKKTHNDWYNKKQIV